MENSLKLTFQKQLISDDYIGYGYETDSAFKWAESHAGEAELLCTYAPDEEYGSEGDIPCIAVVMDDEVFCAVEEFEEKGTFDGCIELCPLSGQFLFKAKMEYYNDMMYFYGFTQNGDEYWSKAGLCLIYPREFVGTEKESLLMKVLDEAAGSFRKL